MGSLREKGPEVMAAGFSHKGKTRVENQDAFLESRDLGLYAVADGMGGLPFGRRASIQVLSILRKECSENPESDLGCGIQAAHRGVRRLGNIISPRRGIGTTVTACRWRSPVLEFIHVGDSVAYRVGEGGARIITEDHVCDRVVIHGAGTSFAPALTRYVGQDGDLQVQYQRVAPVAGEWFVLATDGITKQIPNDELAVIVDAQKAPDRITRALVKVANIRGGEDNATAVVVRFT